MNFKKTTIDLMAPRSELHNALELSGCEVSSNHLPAGAAVPFVHCHKENEELYIVLAGKGEFWKNGFRLFPIATPATASASIRPRSARSAPRLTPTFASSASRRRREASSTSR